MATKKQQRRAVRGAAVVICTSLLCPSTAWISSPPSHQFSASKSSHFRLAADGTSSQLNNPIPTIRTRRNQSSKLMMNMADSFSTNKRLERRKGLTSNQSIELHRKELTNHDVMTRQEELDLGAKVVRANQLRASISALIQEKEDSIEQQVLQQLYSDGGQHLSEDAFATLTKNQVDLDDLPDVSVDEEALFDPNGMPAFSGDELPLANHYQNRQERGMTGTDDWDDALLTEDEIIVGLGLPGGRAELQRILLEGAFARDYLIRNNIRLVWNIAKRWARSSAKYDSADGETLRSIYMGNAHRPSLDEAIQEGVLGLARAADRFDPSRGLRFSTYATYWVTNFVRICFQRAETGPLKVSAQLHTIKNRYHALIKSYLAAGKDVPSEEEIAAELGVNVKRLKTALLFTQRLISLDAPISGGSIKGASAGGGSGGDEVYGSDFLQCNEVSPEEQVELSFLRQCLENAMASELSPHERDVIRLRLGLDDGVPKTTKEVAQVCGGNTTTENIRAAEMRAYKKLRAPYTLSNYKLIAFADFAGIDKSTLTRF